MSTTQQLATGIGGAIGSDFRSAAQQLVFAEYSGKLSAINLFPAATVVAQGTNTVLKGTWTFDFDTGAEGGPAASADVQWDQETSVLRQMKPLNSAKILNLGLVNYASITAASLQGLPYSTTPIVGNDNSTNVLVNNDVFAVLTTSGNFTKVQVVSYGYDMTINWVTYKLGSAYQVLGTGYTQPEDVKLSVDGVHAYVTERSGDLVKVALASANRSSATVVASGLNTPQQLFLDEAHNAAYVVEYTTSGTLKKINLTNGQSTVIFSGLVNPVGVVLSADLQYAYVSEQMTGGATGRISCIQLSSAARTTVASGLTEPFFLTWADTAQDTLLVPQRSPSNSIVSVSVTSGALNVVAGGVASQPSSVALLNPNQMLVCCNTEVDEISFFSFAVTGDLLMGIGLIPATSVTQTPTTGQILYTANTAPNSPYYVTNAPFGGALPIMVNFQAAANAGASFYQVTVDGTPRTDVWTDYFWNGTTNVLQTIKPAEIGNSLGCYPVHPISELFLWESPALGDLVDSTTLSNGQHTLQLVFLDAAGNPISGLTSTPLKILVNNQSCIASISAPVLAVTPPVSADACGVLHYGSNTSTDVSIGFTAGQPAGFGLYSTSIVRGGTELSFPPPNPPLPSGPVGSLTSTFSEKVSVLLGTCPTAGFATELYVAATMTNGYGRQSQYDASALAAFVLTQ